MKISTPVLEAVSDFQTQSEGRLRIFSGNDPHLLEVFSLGATGLVSGNCSVLPAPYVQFANAVGEQDVALMNTLQKEIQNIAKVIGGGAGGIKAALRMLGRSIGRPRMAVTDAASDELREFINGIGSGDLASPGTTNQAAG